MVVITYVLRFLSVSHSTYRYLSYQSGRGPAWANSLFEDNAGKFVPNLLSFLVSYVINNNLTPSSMNRIRIWYVQLDETSQRALGSECP